MRYLLRRIANKALLGKLVKVRGFFDTKINDDISYNLRTDIGDILYFKGVFEQDELNICKKFINENSTILDIGANIGVHTIFFSNIAVQGLVFSIEPQKSVFAILLENTKILKNVVTLNIAVSNSLGLEDFYVAKDDAYSSLKNTKRKALKRVDKVVTVPLDTLMNAFGKIDLVKIDVEGFETEVVKSMSLIIEKYRPIFFIEIYEGTNSNRSSKETIDFLTSKGYQAFVVKNGILQAFKEHDDSYYNYFFTYGDVN